MAYLGRRIQVDSGQVLPKNIRVKASDPNILRVPFEQYFADKNEEETFKQLGELVIHNMAWGYNCFVSSFAIFTSEKEINCQKSQVLKAFAEVNTVKQFKALKLPLKHVTDASTVDNVNAAYEIDLS